MVRNESEKGGVHSGMAAQLNDPVELQWNSSARLCFDIRKSGRILQHESASAGNVSDVVRRLNCKEWADFASTADLLRPVYTPVGQELDRTFCDSATDSDLEVERRVKKYTEEF